MADVNALKRQKSANKGRLTLILNSLKTPTSDLSVEECRAKLARVEQLLGQFTEMENSILAIDDKYEPDMEYEENYYKAVTKINKLIRQLGIDSGTPNTSLDNSTNVTQNGAELRLPKLNIPPFSGEYTEWQSFHDLYVSAIHDSHTLMPVQKFQYLKGLLRGEAASLLRHFRITESNYIEAWQKLRTRYDRKKYTINAFIRTFLDQPTISSANNINVKQLLDTSDEVLRGLKAMGKDGEARDPWLIYIILAKLDNDSKSQWATSTAEKQVPTIQELFEFLLRRSDALESTQSPSKRTQSIKQLSIKGHVVTNQPSCPMCESNNHFIYQCSQFNELEVTKRREWTKENRRCFNCLSDRHVVFKCQSRRRCTICKGRHHTLLHVSQIGSTTETNMEEQKPASVVSPKPNTVSINYGQTSTVQSVLPTAMAKVMSSFGTLLCCRALLDSGSQASFITESCIQRLGIRRKNRRVAVRGLGHMDAGTTRGMATIHIHPEVGPVFAVDVFIINKITSNVPRYNDTMRHLDAWRTLPLADSSFGNSSEIDILIGIDHFFNTLIEGQIRTSENMPILQNTIFGWVAAGNLRDNATHEENIISGLTTNISELDIDRTLRRFWEVEEVETKIILTEEEQFCENHFQENSANAEDGRFIVKLPFKRNKNDLGESLPIAIRRLQGMERRFQSDQWLYDEYKKFMDEYIKLGHMKEIPLTDGRNFGVYLPHHGVLKQSSTTTKLRVVFDASSKTTSHVSLNDCLAVGPTIQPSLTEILLRFRERAIVFAADVEKMYRQVWVDDGDTNFQRIVWRNHPAEPIRHYKLLTVTYGTSSAPFLATRALRDIGLQTIITNPTVSKAILEDFYVDDLLSGANSIDTARKLKEGIDTALRGNGFILRKWVSNADELTDGLKDNDMIQINDNSDIQRVLGLRWSPTRDAFHFHVDTEDTKYITKRKVLSNAGRIFDPLGWLAPVIIRVKIFIQQLWIVDLGWDEPLNDELSKQWREIYQNLNSVQDISINRFIGSINPVHIELHGFCDASERAYAAAIYFRLTSSDRKIIVNLVISKTKVSPIKQLSIPRLELCGAVLLTKLIKSVEQTSTLQFNNIVAWTDSKIVLDWLSSHPQRWKTFIGNRTSEILETIPRHNWKYVRSADNPADCASRGVTPQTLREFDLWWKGPKWLSRQKETWPSPKISTEVTSEELRHKSFNLTIIENLIADLSERYSSFTKLLRIIATIHRFISNCKAPNQARQTSNLFNRDELLKSKNTIIRNVQKQHFKDEVDSLTKCNSISNSSKLKTLSPYIDNYGIMRVGGRLSNSNATYDTKHPVILPYQSIISRRIIEEAHRDYKHAGASLLLANLRQNYWIIGAKRIIRQIISRCVMCTKIRAKTEVQIMADLPTARAEFIRPFLKVGVDFAGPLSIHLTKGRGQKTYKAYICLFICLSVKAVHLELVSSLSSDAFLAALKRFVARRGTSTDIYSDNGTNFVGANKLLQQNFHKLIEESNECSQFFSRNFITWHFNPPSAPSFGGLWESAIKSLKFHLKRIIGASILTMEEMTTLLAEVEAILNCRPLCILSSDDLDVLTPSHFLIGHSNTKILEASVPDVQSNYNQRWQNVQRIAQQFSKRWHIEYLTSLQQRVKWHTTKENIRIGDIVIIKEDDIPSTHWNLGKIIKLHPGKDNIVRVVTLKTKSGILKRPINKLCILPIESDDSRSAACLEMKPENPEPSET